MLEARNNVGAGIVVWMMVVSSSYAEYSTQVKGVIQPSAVAQIEALLLEKRSRTEAQRKISSALLLDSKRRAGYPNFRRDPALRPGIEAEQKAVAVDIEAETTAALLQRIENAGGRVVSSHAEYRTIRARLPIDQLEALARRPEVRRIRPAEEPIFNAINSSEGDVAHHADMARSDFGIDGAGVKACAVSDSIDELAVLQSSGDLPSTLDVLTGQSGNPGSSEGTAMLEIIHDLAPGANLGYATGKGGRAQMAQNILDLEANLGCDVIVDDVFYFSEPVFQDGIVAQAVDTVARKGVLYFSSAGDAGNLNDGTAGVWEGNYVADTDSIPTPLPGLTSVHNFSGDVSSHDVSTTITADPPFFITLHWNDPQDGSVNDYDLFLLDSTLSNVVAASTDTQDGDDDPFESIDSQLVDDTNNRLVVGLFSGSDSKVIHLNTVQGRLSESTNGQISGHAASDGALAVTAVNVSSAGGVAGSFNGSESIEPTASDGPRRIDFTSAGMSIPALVRQKPDLAAADGVSTATTGFNPFFGTSAAAAHAAAMAALVVEKHGRVSYRGFRFFTRRAGLDIEAPGVDRDSGGGIIMADDALERPLFSDGFESGDTSAWDAFP